MPDRGVFALVRDSEQGPPAAVAVAVGVDGATTADVRRAALPGCRFEASGRAPELVGALRARKMRMELARICSVKYRRDA